MNKKYSTYSTWSDSDNDIRLKDIADAIDVLEKDQERKEKMISCKHNSRKNIFDNMDGEICMFLVCAECEKILSVHQVNLNESKI